MRRNATANVRQKTGKRAEGTVGQMAHDADSESACARRSRVKRVFGRIVASDFVRGWPRVGVLQAATGATDDVEELVRGSVQKVSLSRNQR